MARRITKGNAHLILSVKDYFTKEKEVGKRENLARVNLRTANACGVSLRSVERLNNEEYVNALPSDGEAETRSRSTSVTADYQSLIREAFIDLRRKKRRPSLRRWMSAIAQRKDTSVQDLPFSLRTFWKAVYKMGFVRKGISSDTGLKEKLSVVNQRTRYIRSLLQYRAEGRTFYYQDESWINKNLTEQGEWCFGDDSEDLTVPPAGKGTRAILCGIGSDTNGWLPESFLLFRGAASNKSSDYHTEMNNDVFLDWMKTKVIPKVEDRSVIVIDRATYHMVTTPETRPAKSTFTKKKLLEWLRAHNIHDEELQRPDEVILSRPSAGGLSRQELWDIACQNKPEPVYLIQKAIEEAGRDLKLLILPVHHPELNPIETMWSRLKTYAYRNNITFSLKDLEQHVRDEYARITPEHWQAVMKKIKEGPEKTYIDSMDEDLNLDEHDGGESGSDAEDDNMDCEL